MTTNYFVYIQNLKYNVLVDNQICNSYPNVYIRITIELYV